MITKIFRNRQDFYTREDKKVNGVSPEFAKANPHWERENSTNTGCWNCKQCRECWDSSYCVRCKRCMYCDGCRYCTDGHGKSFKNEKNKPKVSLLRTIVKICTTLVISVVTVIILTP